MKTACETMLAWCGEVPHVEGERPEEYLRRLIKELIATRRLAVEYAETIAAHEQADASQQKLVRDIDWILNGTGAAKQASLCDLVGQIRQLKEDLQLYEQSMGEFGE